MNFNLSKEFRRFCLEIESKKPDQLATLRVSLEHAPNSYERRIARTKPLNWESRPKVVKNIFSLQDNTFSFRYVFPNDLTKNE